VPVLPARLTRSGRNHLRTTRLDSAGHVRPKYGTGAGPGTAATDSSFAVLFADAARRALGGT